jgi:hypothetical protein
MSRPLKKTNMTATIDIELFDLLHNVAVHQHQPLSWLVNGMLRAHAAELREALARPQPFGFAAPAKR